MPAPEIDRLVTDSRAAQGLPPCIEDEAVIGKIASLLTATSRQERTDTKAAA